MTQLAFDEDTARRIEAIYRIGDEVGPSGSVVGIGGSPAMLELAARRCAGHDNVELYEADAVALPVEDASRSERVLHAWDEHLAHRSLPRTLAPLLRSVGFEDVRMEAQAFATCEFDRETYGVAPIPFIAQFVAGRDGITEEEAQAWVAEQRGLGERGEFSFASTQFCFTAHRSRADHGTRTHR